MRASSAAWPEVALGALCEINIGRTPARERREFWGPGFPWLSIADMNQGREIRQTKETITERAVRECNCRQVEAGTVLLSFKLSIGKVGIALVPLFTNEAIAALPIRDERKLDPVFLTWALQSIDLTSGLDRAAKGLTLNKAKLIGVPIPLPPLAEQRRIMATLDQAEALRAKRRHALAQLDTLTQSFFLDLFGDPTPNAKGWSTAFLNDLLVMPLRNGLSPSNSGGVKAKVLTLSAITGDTFRADAWKEAPFQAVPPSDQRVDAADLLICRGNGNVRLVGKGYFPPCDMPDLTFPDTMIAARVSGGRAAPGFLQVLWNGSSVRRQIESLARTTNGTFKVNQTMLESIRLIVPPLPLQREFAVQVSAVERLKAAQRASLAKLDALFASLQHRAFRGEL